EGVSWLVHANSRSLFTYYYFILLVQGTSYALLYSFEFNRLRFSCWEFDFRLVILVRTIGVASIAASHFIMVAISIENPMLSQFPPFLYRGTETFSNNRIRKFIDLLDVHLDVPRHIRRFPSIRTNEIRRNH
ncbi:hypothetical protein PMAYCL1PPCAC_24641, partial [Pristionchus mayeri]